MAVCMWRVEKSVVYTSSNILEMLHYTNTLELHNNPLRQATYAETKTRLGCDLFSISEAGSVVTETGAQCF